MSTELNIRTHFSFKSLFFVALLPFCVINQQTFTAHSLANFSKKLIMHYATLIKYFFAYFLVLGIFACGSNLDKTLLHGTWQAVSLLENGQPGTTDLSETQFIFRPTGHYEYRSNINYKEQGTYYLDGTFLVSRDTLQAAMPKSVKIEYLSADSLLFNMNSNGIPQLLGLRKVN